MANSIRFNGQTSNAATNNNQTQLTMNTLVLDLDTSVSDFSRIIEFGSGYDLRTAGSFLQFRIFGTNNRFNLSTTNTSGVLVFKLDDRTNVKAYLNGQELVRTTNRTVNDPVIRSINLGYSAFVPGEDWEGVLRGVYITNNILTEQNVIDISNGDFSQLNNAEIIYNNFTQEEADNNLITNNGSLQGQYDLTLNNVEVVDPYVPPIYTIPIDTLPYLVKPKHIGCGSASALMLSLTGNFDLDVIKLSFFYRQPLSTASRLVSLGAVGNTAGNRNMIRLQNTNRLVIDPNGDNNDTSIPAVQLEAPNFRFVPDTYYNMVIKYDTTINNYKVWINGQPIDMGYSEGQENQRMFVESILLNNRSTLDRSANMEFYNLSFQNSQLSDEECRIISRNFDEVLDDISYKASNVEGVVDIEINETNNSYPGLLGVNTAVIEDARKPLSRILGDGRVIIPLAVPTIKPVIESVSINERNVSSVVIDQNTFDFYNNITDGTVQFILREAALGRTIDYVVDIGDIQNRTLSTNGNIIPQNTTTQTITVLSLHARVTKQNEVLTSETSDLRSTRSYYWKTINDGSTWDTRAALSDDDRDLGEMDLSTNPTLLLQLNTGTSIIGYRTYNDTNSSTSKPRLTSTMLENAPLIYDISQREGNGIMLDYQTSRIDTLNNGDSFWNTPLGYVNKKVNGRTIWVTGFSVQFGAQAGNSIRTTADYYVNIGGNNATDSTNGVTINPYSGVSAYPAFLPSLGNSNVITETGINKLYPGDFDNEDIKYIRWSPYNSSTEFAYGIAMRVSYREWSNN